MNRLKFRALFTNGDKIKAVIDLVTVYPEGACEDKRCGCFLIDFREMILEQTGFDVVETDDHFVKGNEEIPFDDDKIRITDEWVFFDGDIMQYTGKKDKLEKDIFEDDIVAIIYGDGNEIENPGTRHGCTGVVKWDEESTGWIAEVKSSMSVNEKGTVKCTLNGTKVELLITGNIHNNPCMLN